MQCMHCVVYWSVIKRRVAAAVGTKQGYNTGMVKYRYGVD